MGPNNHELQDALIGYTGFVGGNLKRQHTFGACFNSANIELIQGAEFDRVFIAAVQAKKWWANANPNEDRALIDKLLNSLTAIRCRKAILVSTIDVLPPKRGLDEGFHEYPKSLEAYGKNRLLVESEIRRLFDDALVVRLPGLFGPGLMKNVIYDLLTDNQLERINPSSHYQYYDLTRLWADIGIAIEAGLGLVHLFTEPLQTSEIIARYFPGKPVGSDPYPEAHYDFRTCHAQLFGMQKDYIESREEVLERVGLFIRQWRLEEKE